MTKEEFYQKYDAFKKEYGIMCSLWTQAFTEFLPAMFCEKNRDYICKMYHDTERIIALADEGGFAYYVGLDEFIDSYKTAVSNYENK